MSGALLSVLHVKSTVMKMAGNRFVSVSAGLRFLFRSKVEKDGLSAHGKEMEPVSQFKEKLQKSFV